MNKGLTQTQEVSAGKTNETSSPRYAHYFNLKQLIEWCQKTPYQLDDRIIPEYCNFASIIVISCCSEQMEFIGYVNNGSFKANKKTIKQHLITKKYRDYCALGLTNAQISEFVCNNLPASEELKALALTIDTLKTYVAKIQDREDREDCCIL